MAVGTALTSATINQNLSLLSVQLRDLMQQLANLSIGVNGQGTGLAALEAAGYSAADANTALQLIGYMNTVAGVYFGTVQQGGTGGTGAILFNFNQALSQLWSGQ